MATVRPFRALRPEPQIAARVASVPYDVVTVEEARALASGNPLSFLRVSRAEIELSSDTDPYSAQIYAVAADNFRKLRHAAPLVVEAEPSLYFYRLRMDSHEQIGVAAVCSIDEYERNVIRKHERTRPDTEDDRTRHIIALRAQTGPVFLTYRATAEIDAIAARVRLGPPLLDVQAADGVRHTIWRVPEADVGPLAKAFERVPVLYIADGHHRAASAARARRHFHDLNAASHAEAEWDRMLAVSFPHDQVRILPYNRVVRDLGGRSPEEFLQEVSARFPVSPGRPAPRGKGEVSMYVGGRWSAIDLGVRDEDALDVSLLQERLLAPLLKIEDPRTDKRVAFIGGVRGTGELERLVREGNAAAAFSVYPVSIDDLLRVADAGGIMPPKSTWFEPKVRDGLLIHLI